MFRLTCVLIGYIIGCIQTSYFVGRSMNIDLREHSSGNLGATNAFRVLGKKAGAITFVGDILKSVIGFFVCYYIFDKSPMAAIYGSVGVVLGHNYPFYLKFKGGKGIAATIGIVIGLSVVYSPVIALVTYSFGILAVYLTTYVSVGSLLFSTLIPISCFIVGVDIEVIIVTTVLGLLAFYKHKANIERLKNGTENGVFKRKPKKQ